MTQPAQQLNNTLASWRPEVAAHVEQSLTDVITLADTDTLDLQPSRAVVQAVLNALEERLTLATALAGPANRITAILKGQRGITGDTAVHLATFFNTTAEFWMNLQKTYELRLAERALSDKVRKLIEQSREALVSA